MSFPSWLYIQRNTMLVYVFVLYTGQND
uniref:Uncharacterized protein n=1 Tax=Arundo donax TaxID=35708 RepID=A0A0A9DWY0_ARUDO